VTKLNRWPTEEKSVNNCDDVTFNGALHSTSLYYISIAFILYFLFSEHVSCIYISIGITFNINHNAEQECTAF
jgi:hypothetical protein